MNRPLPKHEPTDSELKENQKLRELQGYAPDPFCQICRGFGRLHPLGENGRPDYTKVILCPAPGCMAESKRKFSETGRYLEHKGVTSRLQTFEQYDLRPGTKQLFEAFKSLADGSTDKPLILAVGSNGCGKTHLCQALTKALIARDVNAYYYRAPDLISTLRKSLDDGKKEEWLNALSRIDAFILDDFGMEHQTDWTLECIETIIDARWTNRMITVISTNKDLHGSLQDPGLQIISPRIYSRMCDSELSEVVVCKASDYRLQRPAK